MQSIKYIYKIGRGPSSSHTMGPEKASYMALERFKDANNFKVTLFGSLALTGKGHLTDKVVNDILPNCEITFDALTKVNHPNTMDIFAYNNDELLGSMRVISVGGGTIQVEGESVSLEENIYPVKNFNQTKKYLEENNLDLLSFIKKFEPADTYDHLLTVYDKMQESISDGLEADGLLPGKLKVARKAKSIKNRKINDSSMKLNQVIFSYAYAVSEQNASGNTIVTAPTCGACGVLPAVLFALKDEYNYTKEEIINALYIAGFIGDIVKNNGSISGAEAGCQAEIGTACAMAAAATCYLFDSNIHEIERAAEMALEHHLGLTCDPIEGYVQIPCIERNAVCALRAMDSAKLAKFIDSGECKISFDRIVHTMLETGKDLSDGYRETAKGGLAKKYEEVNHG